MAQMEPVHEFGSWEKLIGQASYGSQFEDDFESNCNLVMLNQWQRIKSYNWLYKKNKKHVAKFKDWGLNDQIKFEVPC